MMEMTVNEMKEMLLNDTDLQNLIRKYDLNCEWLNKSKCVELSSFNAYNLNALQIEETFVETRKVFGQPYTTKVYLVYLDDDYLRLDVSELDYLCYRLFERVDMYY